MNRTVLYDWHKDRAQIVPFAGYSMPIVYSSIRDETISVRKYGGVFDVSHMGKLIIKGKKYLEFADSVFSMNIKDAENYRALYGYFLNERGGILDDLIVYKFPTYILVIVNASNTKKIINALRSIQDNNVEIEDKTNKLSIIAVQGPNVKSSLSNTLRNEICLKKFHFAEFNNKNYSFIIARTGYTGEDGFEIIVEDTQAEKVWKDIFKNDKKLVPCGLGARDVLRLEAGYPLYGHELNENITPLEVDGEKFLYFEKDFIGKGALLKKKGNIDRVLTRFELDTKHIARQNDSVVVNSNVIGYITSGTYSFNFNKSIAMGYIYIKYINNNDRYDIRVQHKKGFSRAKIVDTLFLKYYRKLGN